MPSDSSQASFVRSFIWSCRSGKTLPAVKALCGYEGPERPHQTQVFRRYPEILQGPRERCIMIFSTLPVLQQFLKNTLKVAIDKGYIRDPPTVVAVCSAEDVIDETWYAKVTEPQALQEILKKKDARVLLVTTYASAKKVDEALRAVNVSLDLTVCDEAHNVHTKKRGFLWGGAKDMEDTSRQSSEEEDEDEEEQLDDETMMPSEEGVRTLERRYPRRLYLTATPNKTMKNESADPLLYRVYGNPKEDWDVFKFSDLLKAQRGYDCPCVKEYDVRILVNGKPAGGKRPAEFYDKVCVLREIMLAGKTQQNRITRVLMYHAFAKKRAGVRSAENYGNVKKWKQAFDYLKKQSKRLANFSQFSFDDFEIYSVKGDDKDVREKLEDRFNGPEDGKIHILCSCRIFGEGVTVKRCDMTVFADGKRSPKDIIQSGLRGTKFDEDKPDGRLKILLLTNIDGTTITKTKDPRGVSASILEALRMREKMEPLALTLSLLKEEDEEFAEEVLEALEKGRQERGGAIAKKEENAEVRPEVKKEKEEDSNEAANAAQQEPRHAAAPPEVKRQEDVKQEGDSNAAEGVAHQEEQKATRSGRKRLSLGLAPELFLWKAGEGELAKVTRHFANSMIIEISATKRSFSEMVKWKVDVLCECCRDEKLKGDAKLAVPRKFQQRAIKDLGAKEETVKELYVRGFLRCIYHNWGDAGKKPHTTLQAEEIAKIQRLPWFKAWREGTYGMVKWKVDVLCEFYKYEKPKRKLAVPRKFQQRAIKDLGAKEDDVQEFDGVQFLGHIYDNWGDAGKPNTTLQDEEIAKIESLAWFKAWREGRSGMVKWKVDVLCECCRDEKPKRWDAKLAVPRKFQQRAIKDLGAKEEDVKEFDAGRLLNDIYHNWGDAGKPHTTLQDEEIAKIESLAWFKAWREGRSGRTKWKVDVLCECCRDEKPKKDAKLAVPRKFQQRAIKDLGAKEEDVKEFDGSRLLNDIYHNWGDAGKKPHTTLQAEEIAKIERLPWFKEWRPDVKLIKRREAAPSSAAASTGHKSAESSHLSNRTPAKPSAPRKKGSGDHTEASDKKRLRTASSVPATPTSSVKRKAHALDDASHAFRKEQCEEEEENTQSTKRRKTSKKYDASTFSQAHVNFKNKVLDIILERCPRDSKLSAAFLDDFTEDRTTLRTTQVLLDSGKFAAKELYCANPSQKVAEALEDKGINAVKGVFTDALEEWDESVKFDVAYVDLCTGSADEVLKNLEAVLPRMKPESILAYTITGRAGADKVPDGEHDKTWHSMGDRVKRLHAALDSPPFDFKHITAFEGHSAGQARKMSEIYYSDGARGARVCTGIFRRMETV